MLTINKIVPLGLVAMLLDQAERSFRDSSIFVDAMNVDNIAAIRHANSTCCMRGCCSERPLDARRVWTSCFASRPIIAFPWQQNDIRKA